MAALVAAFAWWELDPHRAPLGVLAILLVGLPRLLTAWRGTGGTALRPAVAWMIGAWVLTALAQLIALLEPVSNGRPGTGHVTYLASLFALAAAVSLLNARRPGEGAWALLTTMLVLVFLVPWLEGSGLAREPSPLDRLRLDAPWSIFFGLLTMTAVINHLPTRFGFSAVCVGLGWFFVFRGLRGGPPARVAEMWGRWGLLMAAALIVREPHGRRLAHRPGPGVERLWLWFRDRWGVVWALRIQERFNREAEKAGWPIRLGWQGVVPVGRDTEVPAAALPTLIALLGRFATRERLEAEAAGIPCGPDGVDRS